MIEGFEIRKEWENCRRILVSGCLQSLVPWERLPRKWGTRITPVDPPSHFHTSSHFPLDHSNDLCTISFLKRLRKPTSLCITARFSSLPASLSLSHYFFCSRSFSQRHTHFNRSILSRYFRQIAKVIPMKPLNSLKVSIFREFRK